MNGIPPEWIPRWVRRRTLKSQGRMLLATGLILSVSIPVVVAALYEWKQLRAAVTTRGRVMVDSLAATAQQALLNYDVVALDDLIHSVDDGSGLYGDLKYAMVLDADGRVLAHSRGYAEYGKVYDDDVTRNVLENSAEDLVQPVGRFLIFGYDHYDISRPIAIQGKRWGTVRVGIDLSAARQQLFVTWGTTALIAVLIGSAIAVLIGQIFRPLFLAPMQELVRSAEALGRRDFGYRISHDRRDEFGEMYDAMNSTAVMLEDREKLYATFGRYVTNQVRDAILSGAVTTTGKKVRAAVVFADLRGFTARSEGLTAEQVLELLNRFCGRMTTAIHAHGGIVDKFIGDSVMAVFGVPIADPEAAMKAVLAVDAMRLEMEVLNTELASQGIEPLRMGVGIHVGECVAGSVGPPTRMQYTVVGDTVNLASRLQTLTKKFGVDVLVSSDVMKECGNWLMVRDLGTTPVEGRHTDVHVFQLLGTKHDRQESTDAIARERERERDSAG